MKNIKNLQLYKIFFLLFNLIIGIAFILFFYFFYHISIIVLSIQTITVWVLFYLMLTFTFKEIIKREKKLQDTTKDLFSSYQYIGNANRKIDILTNLNNYISNADISYKEIASLVVNNCGSLLEAAFCTVFFYDASYSKYRKSKIYYYTNEKELNFFTSHLKCDACTHYMSDNSATLQVAKNSKNKCKYFPSIFWDKYKMICVPFVYKGQKRGYVMLILNHDKEVSAVNLKLVSSLAMQLGTAMVV